VEGQKIVIGLQIDSFKSSFLKFQKLSFNYFSLMNTKILFLFIGLAVIPQLAKARIIPATPATFEAKVLGLLPGDSLQLAAGTYTKPLNINGLNGTVSHPIEIIGTGNSTIFNGDDCCNTISIRKSAYIVIKNMKLDGLNISGPDGIKAEGNTASSPNWTHHITIKNLTIVNYANNQQQVGISTKCPSSNWIIKNNIINGAGTGLYLGNSDGTQPFVNGIIENNFIQNTIGYNIEVKHQINGQRDLAEGVKAGTNRSGKTILRNNVFSKGNNSSTGENARPNVLVGGFPVTGTGKNDYYEVYGNFFYNNPVEALFQGTGNIMLYSNIFVNHANPPNFKTVYITPHNGVSPQNIKIFHNTLWANNSAGGIRISDPDVNYQQYIVGNVAFLTNASTAITASNTTTTLLADNITDSYANAGNYVISATSDLNTLNLYPKAGQLKGRASTQRTLFIANKEYDKDFNNDTYDWTYRGAYSGSGVNKGWKLALTNKNIKKR
jgi:hypothetical protein